MHDESTVAPRDAAARSIRSLDRYVLTPAMPVIVFCSCRFYPASIHNFSLGGLGLHLVGGIHKADLVRIEFFYRHLPVLRGRVEWRVANRAGVRLDQDLPEVIDRILRIRSNS